MWVSPREREGIAALQVGIAEQARELTDKMASHTRNTILAVLAMTVLDLGLYTGASAERHHLINTC